MSHSKNAGLPEILSGWKDIANYLGKGVRTVQRYERELGLPVHRPAGKYVGSVIVTKAELDRWVAAGPTRLDLAAKRLHGRTSRVGADFLRIDSEIALTFSGLALQTSDPEKKRRETRSARKAYDAISRLREKINLNEAESEKSDANLQRLKRELQRLGESF